MQDIEKIKENKQKATNKYRAKKESVCVLFEVGTKDKIKSRHPQKSINQYVNELVNEDLKK